MGTDSEKCRTTLRTVAPQPPHPGTRVLRKKFELKFFSKSYSENADQSERKNAFLFGERTQTRRKVVEAYENAYHSPKQWFAGEKCKNATLNIFQKVRSEMPTNVPGKKAFVLGEHSLMDTSR